MRVLFVISCLFVYVRSTLVDPKGYIAYCPCMGKYIMYNIQKNASVGQNVYPQTVASVS